MYIAMLGNIKDSLFSRILLATSKIKIHARDHFLSIWPSFKFICEKLQNDNLKNFVPRKFPNIRYLVEQDLAIY